jgi:hypothetical protein
MASVIDSYTGGDNVDLSPLQGYDQAQVFTATESYSCTAIAIKLYKDGSPGDITVELWNTAGGEPNAVIVTGTIAEADIPEATDWAIATLTEAVLVESGTQYAVVRREPDASAGNRTWVRGDNGHGYAGGGYFYKTYAGTSWTDDSASYDFLFKTYGNPPIPDDKIYSRTLVTMANNELWHGTSVTTMAEFTDANGDINTGNPLEAVEAYQKLFIVNKTNLKVYDRVNTKLTTADAGANPCTKGMTLTDGTSAASMIVDYVDAVTDDAAMTVYGKRTTTATFANTHTVTGTNANGDAVSFVLNANEDAPPHWYDWTVFGNDTDTYGTMPTSSSMIALWRGRIVTNDDNNPHAWYMTKVDDPFKIKYDYTNDGHYSAVIYTTGKVGTMGDILTALIAYKDDLLIFGGANSIHVIIGDPMDDGQLVQITDDTGIWGSKAWCFDDKNNLYFFGNDGLYKMTVGETVGYPENISKRQLPNLVKDWDLDKDTHRVTVSFDPIEQGILVYKTTLEGGANEGYFYSLVTGGFFPESLPNSCGIYSSYFYPATDETYKKFLIGGADGYIREFDRSTKNDTTTSSTSAINSYYAVLKQMGEDEFSKGMLRKLSGIVAGGAAAGDFSDTDSITWNIYNGNDAETVLEDIIDEAASFSTGTWSTTGKQVNSRVRMRGIWAGLKLSNPNASETWAIEKTFGDIEPKKGKI